MIEIKVPAQELFNQATREFIYTKERTLHLEHSLISISKWESIWKRPFLSKPPEKPDETISYVKCMTIDSNVDPDVYRALTRDNMKAITDYIADPMTATTINDRKARKSSSEVLTSELIYYYMCEFGISWEAEKWHLNRLLMLIKVLSIKQGGHNQKMSKSDIYKQNAQLNAMRRAKARSRG